MTAKDLRQVMEIERRAFEQPYSREILAQELKIEAAHVWVVHHGLKIVAYIDFWLLVDEIELVSIAVHPDFKRKGIGELMMQHMIKFAEEHQVRFLFLDVRVSNSAAQHLYEKLGFQKIGRRKRYYTDNNEDALMMRKEMFPVPS